MFSISNESVTMLIIRKFELVHNFTTIIIGFIRFFEILHIFVQFDRMERIYESNFRIYGIKRNSY